MNQESISADGVRKDEASGEGDRETQRLLREAAFHDDVFAQGTQQRLPKYYRITADSTARYRELIQKISPGAQVLEYGCGAGSMAYEIARLGGHAVGIDISPVAIEVASKAAAAQGLASHTRFVCMNAEHLDLPAAMFDLVCGSGILHHLNLSSAYAEIARVLKPGGRAVFFEPLGHNPLINLYRRLTPSLRTPDEHPLLRRDIALARESFEVTEEFYHLFSIGLAFCPAWLARLGRPIAAFLDRIVLHRLSPFRYQAWIVVLRLTKKGEAGTR